MTLEGGVSAGQDTGEKAHPGCDSGGRAHPGLDNGGRVQRWTWQQWGEALDMAQPWMRQDDPGIGTRGGHSHGCSTSRGLSPRRGTHGGGAALDLEVALMRGAALDTALG
ncbi:hypothetical protein NDU88_008908 [Pleurodeles waltl]|uniref:Uncharacterized protein n=1 Tax=Pleurodeles waltl TaxID=8319 RepID=A0AAV7P0M6_PLEWA|nr:hypothetical protein NDU88_008908 [Pleurodeles waltl]